MNKVKEVKNIALIILLALSMTYIFYIVTVLDGDAFEPLVVFYRQFDLGQIPISKGFTNIADMIGRYLYPKIGVDERIVYAEFCFEFFVSAIMAFILTKHESKSNDIWCLFLLTYILLPGKMTPIYHWISVFSSLVFIYIITRVLEERKPQYIIMLFVWIYIYHKIAFDIALIGINVIIPVFLYILLFIIQSEKRRKYIPYGCVGFIILIAAYRVLYLALNQYTSIAIPYSFEGYGGSSYAYWGKVDEIINYNIGYYIKVLFNLWNIQSVGSLISFESISVCIRSTILFLALFLILRNLFLIIKNGTNSIPIVDGICALSFLVISATNIINGSTTENGGISRYAGVTIYLLAITLVREVGRIINSQKVFELFNISQKKMKLLCGVFCFSLIVIFVEPIYKGKTFFESYHNQLSERVAEKIEKNSLVYGLGSWEDAVLVFGKSKGKCKVVPARLGNTEMGLIKDTFNSDTADGYKFFNYIMITPQNATGQDSNSIKELYGEPIKEVLIKNKDEWVECAIEIYDYDVRWRPEYFYSYENCFEKREIPLGISRLIVTGKGIGDAEITLGNNIEVVKNVISDERVIFDLINGGDTFLTDIHVETNGEVQFGIAERIYAAIDLFENQIVDAESQIFVKVDKPCEEYRIIVQARNANMLEMYSNNNVMIERMDSGNERLVYRVSNSAKKPYELVIKNMSNNDITIEKGSINELQLQFRN